jgi:hypothetical protein
MCYYILLLPYMFRPILGHHVRKQWNIVTHKRLTLKRSYSLINPVTVWSFVHLNIGGSSQETTYCEHLISVFPGYLSIDGQPWDDHKGSIHSKMYAFSLSHHVQPGRGDNPAFSPVSLFPWTWSCQNMKLTPHSCPLRRGFYIDSDVQ